MPSVSDTIVAVSSPLGGGPRAILRLSGPEALGIAGRLFLADSPVDAGTTYRAWPGAVRLACGAASADVPATMFVMRAPRSYTREDVVELHLPGNPPLVAEALAGLCRAGARPAAPGEFTARAFASGRLDLAQAEAVMAIVNASGSRSLSAAHRLLEGRLSAEVDALADRLRSLAARVELALDFSDQDVPLVDAAEVGRAAAELRDDVVRLARRSREVVHADGDFRVALVGRPNVGKSSLFNRLCGADRALVADVPGTTRDELRETFVLGGWRFALSDTAGLAEAVADLAAGPRGTVPWHGHPARASHGRLARGDDFVGWHGGLVPPCESPVRSPRRGKPAVPPGDSAGPAGAGSGDDGLDTVEGAARQRTLEALARAELVLVVVEAAHVLADAVVRRDVARLLSTLTAPAILVVNKCDLLPAGGTRGVEELSRAVQGGLESAGPGVRVVVASAATGQGIEELRRAIVDTLHLGEADRASDAPAVAARHRQCLEQAAEALDRVASLCRDRLAEDLAALELREALDALGGITGRTAPQDVLAEVFAGFCVGK